MRIHTVTDITIPELQPYRTLRRSVEQYQKGHFIAEGEKVVDRLFKSDLNILSVLLSTDWFERKKDVLSSLPLSPDVYVGEKRAFEDIVGHSLHQGIMALATIPKEPDLNQILKTTHRPHLMLAIDHLANAENVGIIVRNAAAFGVTCVLVGETSSSPYLRRAVRNSLGAVFTVPVIHVKNLAATLVSLTHDHNVHALAAETGKNGVPLDSRDLQKDVCFVVGGEDKGIRTGVLESCSDIVEIPMVKGVDSLNVANASAICLYEARQQRRGSE